jgi:hypothetical protein
MNIDFISIVFINGLEQKRGEHYFFDSVLRRIIFFDVPEAGDTIEVFYGTAKTTPAIYADFISLIQDGYTGKATTKLIIAVSNNVSLELEDILFFSGITGASITGITEESGDMAKIYELSLSGITQNGQVTVGIDKDGYNFTPDERSVGIYYAQTVQFQSLTQDGSLTQTTTKLVVTLNNSGVGLTAANMSLAAGTTGASIGSVVNNGNGTYDVTLTGITSSGEVSLSLSKAGYTITPMTRNVEIHYADDIAFQSLTADGGTTAMTTKLTITLDNDVAGGLVLGDITFNGGTTGATATALV